MSNPTPWTGPTKTATAWTVGSKNATAWARPIVTQNRITESSENRITEAGDQRVVILLP